MEIDGGTVQGRIENEDQAINFVEGLVTDMERARAQCNVHIPASPEMTVKLQRRALWVYLTKQGKVVGALQALLAMGKISERCYKELNQKAINTLTPTLVKSPWG